MVPLNLIRFTLIVKKIYIYGVLRFPIRGGKPIVNRFKYMIVQ